VAFCLALAFIFLKPFGMLTYFLREAEVKGSARSPALRFAIECPEG
jgi:hypothetical protein